MFKRVAQFVQARLSSAMALALVAVLGVVSFNASATDPIVINDVGNAGEYIDAAITALGLIAGAVLAGFFGFWLVKKTFAWAGKIG